MANSTVVAFGPPPKVKATAKLERQIANITAQTPGQTFFKTGHSKTRNFWGEDNFKDAIGQFLESERNVVDDENEILTSYGPFKKNNLEENYE